MRRLSIVMAISCDFKPVEAQLRVSIGFFSDVQSLA